MGGSKQEYFLRLIASHNITKLMRTLLRLPKFAYGQASFLNAEVHKPSFGEVQKVTLIPGIGIGPEIARMVNVR